jgi:hypothetical protein
MRRFKQRSPPRQPQVSTVDRMNKQTILYVPGDKASGHWAAVDRIFGSDRMDFAVIAAVVVYITVGPFQHFPPSGWVDSGIYTGYFRHFGWMNDHYGSTYFASRWPYILPGWLIYRVFPAWAANIVLSAAWLTVLLIGLRSLARGVLPAWARKWMLILFGVSPLAVSMVTRAYPDGAVAGIGLFGLAFVWRGMVSTRAAGPASFAGVSLLALALLTQPGSLYMVGPIGLGLLLTFRPKDMRAWLLKALPWAGVGFIATSVLYLVIVYKITGVENLFGLMYAACCENQRGTQYRWDVSLWIFSATRIHFVLLVLAAGLLTLAFRARDLPDALRRFLACSLIATSVSAALLLFSDIALHMSLIQSPHYASYILPATTMLLGAILATWGYHLSLRDRALTSIAVVTLATAGVALLMLSTAGIPQDSNFFPVLDLACGISAIAAIVAMRRTPHSRRGGILIALVVALLPLSSVSADTRHVFRGRAHSSGSTYGMLLTAADQIDEMAGDRSVLFWFDRRGFNEALTRPVPNSTVPDGELYPLRHGVALYELNALDTLNAFYLWDRSRLNDQLPALTPTEAGSLKQMHGLAVLVVVSHREEDLDQARSTLSAAGVPFTVSGRSTIRGLWFSLHLEFLDL